MADNKKDKHYAWSTILVGDEDGLHTIAPGSAVTPKDLATDDEGFQAYLLSGAVRPYEYPDMPKTAVAAGLSPLEYMRNSALDKANAEEERLAALMSPEILRASIGPVVEGTAILPEAVEEGTGPSEEATAPSK